MSDQSVLQIDTDEELARVMRQLKTLPQQLGRLTCWKKCPEQHRQKGPPANHKGQQRPVCAEKRKKALQSESKILSASASTLEAAVLAKGPMRDIMDFMTQPNTDTAAAAAKVLKQRGHETAGGGRPESVYYHVPIRAHRHCAAPRRGTPPRQKAAFACRSPT